MSQPTINDLLRLKFCPNVGDRTARKILKEFDNLNSLKKDIHSNKLKTAWSPFLFSREVDELVQRELKLMDKYRIQYTSVVDDGYPKLLKECYDAPFMLFFLSKETQIGNSARLSIVGTRDYTPYGQQQLKQLFTEIDHRSLQVVSGLAIGIDGIAHKESLEKGMINMAVLGNGFNQIYPKSHTQLAKDILENNGFLITEFTYETKPNRENFPKRNRIVAGISSSTLVVETDLKGGAMITALLAFDYNRNVYAIPGKNGHPKSRGCNYLIESQKAQLCSGYSSIAKDYEISCQKQTALPLPLLNDVEASIMDFLDQERHIDELIHLIKISLPELSVYLLGMEMNGWIDALPGKRFKKRGV